MGDDWSTHQCELLHGKYVMCVTDVNGFNSQWPRQSPHAHASLPVHDSLNDVVHDVRVALDAIQVVHDAIQAVHDVLHVLHDVLHVIQAVISEFGAVLHGLDVVHVFNAVVLHVFNAVANDAVPIEEVTLTRAVAPCIAR